MDLDLGLLLDKRSNGHLKPSRPRLVPARPKVCTRHVREPLRLEGSAPGPGAAAARTAPAAAATARTAPVIPFMLYRQGPCVSRPSGAMRV